MTQEESIQSKRQELWTRMYGLLDLNPGAVKRGGRGRVLMAIRPTIAAEGLLLVPDIQSATVSLSVAAVAYHTVPEDEKWLLLGFEASRGAGDRDVTQVNLLEPGNLGGNSIGVFEQAAAGAVFHMLQYPIYAYAGWVIRLIGSGGTTNGDWTLNVLTYVSPSWLT